jgi:anti-sigma factor RsiW
VYFETAKAAYAEELAKLGEKPDLTQKQVAQFAARKAALKAALDGVDMAELESAWKKYVVAMKDPWPSLRKKRK